MRSIDVAAIIIATADFEDETGRQNANIAAVAAAAAGAVDNDVFAALDATAAVVILSWKCPVKTDEAFKNMESWTAAVDVDDVAAVVILGWVCPAKTKKAGKNLTNASLKKAKNTASAPSFALLAETTAVAPSFAMLVEAAIAVALVATNIANAYNLYATSPILGDLIIVSRFRQTSLLVSLLFLTRVNLALVA